MSAEFDLAQSFYVDKDAVRQADTIYITSVDLFFKNKPAAGRTKTGIYKPGVSVYICPIDNEYPKLDEVFPEVARVEYDSITETSIASTATNFKFNYPIPIKTARMYAVLVKLDGSDDDFKLWWNKAGEKVLNTTNNTQVSSGKVDGFFYTITNGKSLTALKDADLKFNLNIARFTAASATYKLHNSYNEFLKFHANSITGNFKGGEYVYQSNSPSTGNLVISSSSYAVVGNGTFFTDALHEGDKFILTDGTSGNADVHTVNSISNNTYLTLKTKPSFSNSVGKYLKTPIGTVFVYNAMTERLVLEDSTANSTVHFTANSTVYGVDSKASCGIEYIEDFEANYIRPAYNILTPAGTSTNVAINIANTTYNKNDNFKVSAEIDQVKFIDNYSAAFGSRSHEILHGATLFDDSKSFESELTFQTSNIYTSPYAKEENLDVFVTRYVINNDATNEYTNFGNAASKYISKRVALADGQDSEDIRVYLTAYKPANTDIRVYAKLHNNVDPDPFDDKNWTALELVTDRNLVSSQYNRDDTIELEYKIPYYPTSVDVDGLFTTQSGNAVITSTSATVNTSLSVNDVVKVYQPNYPNNHIISIVTAANTSSITVADAISNASMVTTGLKVSKIDQPHAAFINIQNNNVVRYYNTSYSAFDSYKNFSIKVVLLSDTDYRVPHVDDLRAIAVSS